MLQGPMLVVQLVPASPLTQCVLGVGISAVAAPEKAKAVVTSRMMVMARIVGER